MFLSPKVWLGGVALSGILLAGSIPVATAASQPSAVPSRALGTVQVSTGTYAQVIHKELKWAPINDLSEIQKPVQVKRPVVVAATESAQQPVQPNQKTVEQVSASAVARRPVQVAQATASRGGSDATGLIARALSLRGIPYVFGGTSRSGFDCSGFTQYVFAANGISLPRTSYAQFGVGGSVSRADLQPGDLVFFTTYSQGASHVGIYIGGGRFIHASDGGVRITSLSDSYYAKRFLGARRVR